MKCDHVWHLVSDWSGDAGLPRGTVDFEYACCSLCGEESTDRQVISEVETADDYSDAEWFGVA